MNTLEQNTGTDHFADVIAKRLKLLMKQHNNISATELARQTNIPQPTLHRLLSGDTVDPRVSTLNTVANFFGVSIDYFLSNTHPSAHTQNSTHIPLLSWKDVTGYSDVLKSINAHSLNINWIQTDANVSTMAFALPSKKSISVIFPIGSILIIDPNIEPSDGDLVLIIDTSTQEPTLRELIIDGPQKVLYALDKSLDPIQISNKTSIIGVLAQTKFTYKK